MKQWQLSIRTGTTVGQQLPADYKEKLATFRSYCKSKISEKNIQPHCIINMDEVPLTFDMPLMRTVEHTGTSMVPIRTTGNEKTSFVVVLGISSNGQKLHPMAIFKRKTLPKDKFPKGIKVAVNPKDWMDEQVMRTWLSEVYGGRLDRFFHPLPRLLIFDSMCAHKTNSVKAMVKKMNSELAVIPGGLTKEVQPLDIADTIPGLSSNAIESTESDNSDGENMGDVGLGLLDAPIALLVISDMEDEDVNDFMEDEAADEVVDE
ncbi:pogo transposable element with KRAB domain-like protein [Turdus rufiventris]|nr:pogo transposable element with KRAB domain-like protein [Turdus rufiventris]